MCLLLFCTFICIPSGAEIQGPLGRGVSDLLIQMGTYKDVISILQYYAPAGDMSEDADVRIFCMDGLFWCVLLRVAMFPRKIILLSAVWLHASSFFGVGSIGTEVPHL